MARARGSLGRFLVGAALGLVLSAAGLAALLLAGPEAALDGAGASTAPAAGGEAAEAAAAAVPAPEAPAAPAAPPEPVRAWRDLALPFSPPSPETPLVAVILTAPDPGRLRLVPARTLGAPATIAVDLSTEDGEALARSARALGFEVLALADGAAPALSHPDAAGVALAPGFAADPQATRALLDAAAEARMMVIDLGGDVGSPAVDLGLAEGMPVAGAALWAGRASATLAFETLREGARRALSSGSAIVAMEASPDAFAALGRWAAVETVAAAAPASAVVARGEPARY